MTLDRRTLLVSILLALCAFVAWDYFFAKSKSLQTVLPAKTSGKAIPQTSLEKQVLERRPKFAEVGEDLFYNAADKPKQPLEVATTKPKQHTFPVRKVDSAKASTVQTAPTPVVTTNIPQPVVTPSLGYVSFGQYRNEDKRYLLMGKNAQTTAVQIGDVLDGTWKLISLSQSIASFQHLPTGQTSQLTVAPLP